MNHPEWCHSWDGPEYEALFASLRVCTDHKTEAYGIHVQMQSQAKLRRFTATHAWHQANHAINRVRV